MSIFNEKQRKAMTDGEYICSECGELMEFEDEKYENLYPTREEVLDIATDDSEEEN